ncbi:MAG: hypothetical protein MUC95_02810 [Spirochaetes bacterium]|nr:hypothetical protein [Spirochaetota bacterium]
MDKKKDKKIGQFLIENEIITREQLNEALDLQKFNPERLVGEVLVTQGVLSKEDLVMALEMFMMTTGILPDHVDEWLDQEEVDMLLDRIKKK